MVFWGKLRFNIFYLNQSEIGKFQAPNFLQIKEHGKSYSPTPRRVSQMLRFPCIQIIGKPNSRYRKPSYRTIYLEGRR